MKKGNIHDAILNGDKDNFFFEDVHLEMLFLNKLRGPYFGHGSNVQNTIKEEFGQQYRINNFGFRGNDITGKEKILFGGCSHTFGVGIPEEYIWPTLVAKNFGYEYANLSSSGASTMNIVKRMFAYFKEFGNPEIIVCFFPDFTRMYLPISRNFLQTDRTIMDGSPRANNYLDHEYLRDGYEVPLFSKKPHKVKDIIPEDVPYWMAIQSITILEQYCEQAGIKLVWSIWEKPVYRAVDMMRQKDNSYFKYMKNINVFNWPQTNKHSCFHQNEVSEDDICNEKYFANCSNITNCHEDLKNENESIFFVGTDSWHWGTHRHRHVADDFIKEINNIL